MLFAKCNSKAIEFLRDERAGNKKPAEAGCLLCWLVGLDDGTTEGGVRLV